MPAMSCQFLILSASSKGETVSQFAVRRWRLLGVLLLCLTMLGCQNTKHHVTPDRHFTVMAINDVYRMQGLNQGQLGGLARVKALRDHLLTQGPVLFLHAGDFLHPSFISKQDGGASMIKALNQLDADSNDFDKHMLVTFGNHEFDQGKASDLDQLRRLIETSEFTWLDTNINWLNGNLGLKNVSDHQLIEINGVMVGIFSHTTDMNHPAYIESFTHLSESAAFWVPKLRAKGAEVVIALTHHWVPDDTALMNLPESNRPDVIFGGHEHHAMAATVNDRWIVKADADAASATVAQISVNAGNIKVFPSTVPLDQRIQPDTTLQKYIQIMINQHDQSYCLDRGLTKSCLAEVLALTDTELIAEETEIRRFETNLGNLLSDLVLTTFSTCQADVALLNSGMIRLNQNIPAGSAITNRHLEEMFPYPSDFRLIELTPELLQSVLNHSVSAWTANGHWLQVAGLAYIHDPESQQASHIHVKGHSPLSSDEANNILAVVPNYLIADFGDQDGYDMLDASMQVDCPHNGADLKQLFKDFLQQADRPIMAHRDHRICNAQQDSCQ